MSKLDWTVSQEVHRLVEVNKSLSAGVASLTADLAAVKQERDGLAAALGQAHSFIDTVRLTSDDMGEDAADFIAAIEAPADLLFGTSIRESGRQATTRLRRTEFLVEEIAQNRIASRTSCGTGTLLGLFCSPNLTMPAPNKRQAGMVERRVMAIYDLRITVYNL